MNWQIYVLMAAMLVFVNRARAQADDETPDNQLTAARLLSDPVDTIEPGTLRPQLVEHDTRTPIVVGTIVGVVGVGGLVASWAMYVARENYRQQPWARLDASMIDSFESRGAWAFWLGFGSSGALINAEYLLLPEAPSVPTLAWFAGGTGLVTAAIGMAFYFGGAHCGPQAVAPGARLVRDCLSGTADALFGPMLMLTAAPLINVPLTYLFRSLFAGAPEALSLTPTGFALRAAF